MNALLLLTILSLTLPIYGQKTQEAKKQDKRGIVALGYGGYERGGLALRGGLLSAGYGGYGNSYLGHTASTLGNVIAAPAYSQGYSSPIVSHYNHYNVPTYPLYQFGYSGDLGYNSRQGVGLGYGFGAGFGNNYVQGW